MQHQEDSGKQGGKGFQSMGQYLFQSDGLTLEERFLKRLEQLKQSDLSRRKTLSDMEKSLSSAVGAKYDDGKTRYDLIPAYALYETAEIFTFGARKYADRNWEKGIAYGRLFGAILRHLWKFWRGIEIDEESGKPHLAHATCGCLMLLEMTKIHPDLDDRPKGV